MTTPAVITVDDELSLRPITARDGSAITELLNDREVSASLTRVPHPYGEPDFDSFQSIADKAAADFGDPLHFTIHHTLEGPVGGFGFHEVSRGHSAEIGYWLGRRYWGQGIMTRVVKAGAMHARRSWNTVRITAHIFEHNERSASVLTKCGFREEGLLRSYLRVDGEYVNARLYADVRALSEL